MFESYKIFVQSAKSKSNHEILNFIQRVIKWKKIKEKFNHIELAQSILEDSKYIEYLKQEEKNSKNHLAYLNNNIFLIFFYPNFFF